MSDPSMYPEPYPEPLHPEPLHQPPDPRDLRAVPPATPECAIVRGRLRDFVDGDLGPAARRHVEDHAHICRTCAVALSRAEHELLRLRRAFGLVAIAEPDAGLPRAGFAGRVVNRLVLDETSLLSREMLAAAEQMGSDDETADDPRRDDSRRDDSRRDDPSGSDALTSDASSPDRNARGDSLRVRASRTLQDFAGRPVARRAVAGPAGGRNGFATAGSALATPAGFLMACVVLLTLLVVVVDLGSEMEQVPTLEARLVVIGSHDAYSGSGLLGNGQGLGPGEKLWVGVDGEAFVDLIDASSKNQPAATLQVTDGGTVSMRGGDLLLESGRVRVGTQRDVSFLMADGSRLELGSGDYAIAVEDLRARHRRGELAAPGDLRIAIEVLNGDSAQIVRANMPSVVITAGEQGDYLGRSRVNTRTTPGAGSSTSTERNPPAPVVDPVDATLSGFVLERSGAPAIDSDVILSFATGGRARSGAAHVGNDGQFYLATGAIGTAAACDSPFAIVQVIPKAARDELGLTAAEVFRLAYVDGNARLVGAPVVEQSTPVLGQLIDQFGSPRSGVRVVPCITDDLFGTVWPWLDGQVSTDAEGRFRIARLPGVLPAHEHLDIILLHPELEPTVVAVPPRNLPGASVPLGEIHVNTTRSVRLELSSSWAPVTGNLMIYEDVPGLPAGVAMCRRHVFADAAGVVASVQVGRGDLWLRGSGSHSQEVSKLVNTGSETSPRYVIAPGSPSPVGAQFQAMEQVSTTNFWLASSFRFQRYSAQGVNAAAQGTMVYVRDALSDRALSGTQLFAVQAGGPRGRGPARFLGLSNGNGSLSADLLVNESLVVVSPDGAIGSVAEAQSGDDVIVPIRANGRLNIGAVAQAHNPGLGILTVRLRRVDSPAPGVHPQLVRFVRSFGYGNSGWIIDGIPPGRYAPSIEGQEYAEVDVPASGYVELH